MHHLPEPFIRIISQLIDGEINDFVSALSTKAPSSIRLNPFKPQLINNDLEKVIWTEHGYYQEIRPKYTLDPLLHAGVYYVQEASSMYLGHLLKSLVLPKDSLILDLCAAPGGKSTDILSNVPLDSFLVANEVINSRSQILKENLTKFGRCNNVVTNSDPSSFTALGAIFDLIVVDAPCSGEGMFRKDPKAIGEWSEANVHLCYQRQQRILSDIWPCLKPGGILVYSSCTYNSQEDEENIKWLLHEYSSTMVPMPHEAKWGLFDTGYGLKFFPHRVKGEGFFISCVQKSGELTSEGFNIKKSKFERLSKEDSKTKNWVKNETDFDWVKFNNVIKVLPKNRETIVSFLATYLKIVKAGVDICEIKGKDYIPCQDLAMFTETEHSAFKTIELSEENALQYLRKEGFSIDAESGIILLTYKGLGLGFVKKIGSRFNNYYPQEWRIRMK